MSASSNTSALDPTYPGYVSFVNSSMIETAQSLGLTVKPYTIDRLNTVEQLYDLGVEGIITDYVSVIEFVCVCYCKCIEGIGSLRSSEDGRKRKASLSLRL